VTSEVITARHGRDPDPGPFPGVPDWLRIQTLQVADQRLEAWCQRRGHGHDQQDHGAPEDSAGAVAKNYQPRFGPQSSIGSTRTESGFSTSFTS
jgi:hypothetical protein